MFFHTKMQRILNYCFLFSFLVPMCHSAHILFFHNLASYSHRVTTYPLADALAKRGHQVTFMNPFHHRGPNINPNITEIVPRSMEKFIKDWLEDDFDINNRVTNSFKPLTTTTFPAALSSCQKLFDSPELAQFYNTTKSLDLIIMDNCNADCAAAIAYKYKAKHIIYNTVIHLGYEFDRFGLVPESSSIPELEIKPFVPPMTFWERVVNTFISINFRWEQLKFISKLDVIARKHLNDPLMPSLEDIMRNASLVFYTGDVLSEQAHSHSPLFINIGGIYCKDKPDPLPQQIMEFIENDPSSDGIVYISLGSLAISSNLPESVKQQFMNTIRQFPKLRFIWKWDSPIPANKPENLYLAKWLPQTDILAHPKMRAFVTQCGRPSTLEALCNAVPMVAFPVLGDQDNNANRMNQMGGNVKLELSNVTSEEFVAGLEKVVYDPRMKARMVELRNILLDRPLSALDTAVWWTEYVLRHNDTSYLRPAGFDQWWYQRRFLDVWTFVLVALVVTIVFIAFIILLLVKYVKITLEQFLEQEPKRSKVKQKVN